MIEVKTADLIGVALDYAVSVASGHEWTDDPCVVLDAVEGKRGPVCSHSLFDKAVIITSIKGQFRPSTDWSQCGPLIEKYQLSVTSPKSSVHRYGGPKAGWGESGCWGACTWTPGHDGRRDSQHHETSPLVAVCRTIVASVLGDVVQVPAELVEVKP